MLWWGGLAAYDWQQSAVVVSSKNKNDYPADKDVRLLRNVGNFLIIYTAFVIVAMSIL
jgi:hypothetical protein